MKKKVLENAGIVHVKKGGVSVGESLVSRKLCLFFFSLLAN